MDTTTPRLIRADFRTQITSIVPTHSAHQTSRFRHVRSVDLVQGPELRNFHLNIPTPARAIDNGGYGDGGVDHQFTLEVWVSYGGLAPEDDDSIITEDGVNIWDALQARYEPALPGLISVEPDGWIEGDDTSDGNRWGAHTFTVIYNHSV